MPSAPQLSCLACSGWGARRCCASWASLCSTASSKGVSIASSQSKSSCVTKPGIFAEMAKQEYLLQASPKKQSRQLHNSYTAAGQLAGWNEVMVHAVGASFAAGCRFLSSGLAGRRCVTITGSLTREKGGWGWEPSLPFCLPWYECSTLWAAHCINWESVAAFCFTAF